MEKMPPIFNFSKRMEGNSTADTIGEKRDFELSAPFLKESLSEFWFWASEYVDVRQRKMTFRNRMMFFMFVIL